MTWLADHWLDLLGWGGSALLVYSLLQASVLRLRVLNAIACVVLIVFNAVLAVWPMVGMNVVLVAINVWFIAQLLRQRHDETVFEVLPVGPDEAYLAHVLRTHAADIARFNPQVDPGSVTDRADLAYVVQRGDETVGVVLLELRDGEASVLLDYVTPRYRDFSPGEFVWRRSGLLAGHGVSRVVTPQGMVGAYYGRIGFTRRGEAWQLDVTP